MSPLWLQQFVLAFVSNPTSRIVLAAKRIDNSCYRMVLSPPLMRGLGMEKINNPLPARR